MEAESASNPQSLKLNLYRLFDKMIRSFHKHGMYSFTLEY